MRSFSFSIFFYFKYSTFSSALFRGRQTSTKFLFLKSVLWFALGGSVAYLIIVQPSINLCWETTWGCWKRPGLVVMSPGRSQDLSLSSCMTLGEWFHLPALQAPHCKAMHGALPLRTSLMYGLKVIVESLAKLNTCCKCLYLSNIACSGIYI